MYDRKIAPSIAHFDGASATRYGYDPQSNRRRLRALFQLPDRLAARKPECCVSDGSPALPSRLIGAKIQVAVPPKQMALTLIRRSASSKATDFVNPPTQNFSAV